jgi:hypothetical protein
MRLIRISEEDALDLRYLARSPKPLWGGHLERNEPPGPHMRRWIDLGLIQQVGDSGYIATELCHASLRWPAPPRP